MWIHPIAILARGENPIVGVIAVLVIIGLGLLSKWLSAKQQREQQEEARQKELEKRRRPGQAQPRAAAQAPPPRETGAGGPSRLVRRTPYQQPAPPAAPSPRETGAGQPSRLVRRAAYQRPAPPPVAPVQPQRTESPGGVSFRRVRAAQPAGQERMTPTPASPGGRTQPLGLLAQAEAVRVAQELRLQQQRLAQEETQRGRRLARRRSPEEDSAAIEQRLIHVAPAAQVGGEGPAAVQVSLADRDAARRAIVFHEILAQPKGLRHGPEMWDV